MSTLHWPHPGGDPSPGHPLRSAPPEKGELASVWLQSALGSGIGSLRHTSCSEARARSCGSPAQGSFSAVYESVGIRERSGAGDPCSRAGRACRAACRATRRASGALGTRISGSFQAMLWLGHSTFEKCSYPGHKFPQRLHPAPGHWDRGSCVHCLHSHPSPSPLTVHLALPACGAGATPGRSRPAFLEDGGGDRCAESAGSCSVHRERSHGEAAHPQLAPAQAQRQVCTEPCELPQWTAIWVCHLLC